MERIRPGSPYALAPQHSARDTQSRHKCAKVAVELYSSAKRNRGGKSMRLYLGHGTSGFLVIAAAISSQGSAATAGELFVMPYSCAVVGGHPMLAPSDDKGYSIIGRREQRSFSACSPMNPSLCRQWTLYRFDLDCGGARVPWMSVAAAAAERRNGRSWVEHGRLHMEMPSRWTMASDDPCAQEPGYNYRWRSGGYARYCADRRSLAQGPIIEMPDGFAPMMGLNGIFVSETAAKSNPNAAASTTAAQLSPKVALKEHPKPVSAAASANPMQNSPASTHEASKLEDKTATATAVAGSPNAHSDVAPQVVNQASPPQTESRPEALREGSIAQAASANSDQPGVVTGSVSVASKDGPPPKDIQPPLETDGTLLSLSSNILPGIRSSLSATTLAVGGLTALGLIVLTFVRRERAQPSFLSSRDIAAVSLDGRSSGHEIVFSRGLMAAKFGPKARGVQTQRVSEASTDPQPIWSDHIPQTLDEALRVLGMGVGPDANDAAIKKIIDGLRLSWHPDHANGVADRELRELRMKQINAAWDIIAHKRSSV